MLKKLIVLITISIFSINSIAQDVVRIEKGEKAIFAGALVSEKKLNDLRQNEEKRVLLEKKVLKMEDLGLLSEEKLDIYRNRVYNVEKELSKSNRRTFWSNIGYFALGAILTGFATKVAIESGR